MTRVGGSATVVAPAGPVGTGFVAVFAGAAGVLLGSVRVAADQPQFALPHDRKLAR